jgi:chemotaxis protein methyltransferase CheR
MAGCAGVSEASIVVLSSAENLPADPAWPRLKDYLIGLTGLHYYSDKNDDLARRVHRRMSALGGLDCAAYLRLLRDAPAERGELIAGITIGETYFFRHREHFDAIRDVVLPNLARRNATARQMRIWSAGCADGCEPYSLSILLRHELGGAETGSILATDISQRHLELARAARFEEWAFRAMPDGARDACFHRQGKQWLLSPRFRSDVSFESHNLADDAFPAGPFDLIVCRNVMIYFAPELMRRVIMRFHDCLAPGGWLLVGPSEPNMSHFAAFRTVNAPGVTLYQRPMSPAAAPLFTSTAAPAVPPIPAPNTAPAPDNLNPLAHLHRALEFDQAGHAVEAEKSLRRAIYLDRACAPAHFHLGVLLRSRSDLRHAGRCFANTIQALASQPEDAAVPGAGGATAAELTRLAEFELERIRARASQGVPMKEQR